LTIVLTFEFIHILGFFRPTYWRITHCPRNVIYRLSVRTMEESMKSVSSDLCVFHKPVYSLYPHVMRVFVR